MEIFNNVLIAIDFKTETEQAKIDRVIAMAQEQYASSFTFLSVVPEVVVDPEQSIISSEKQQQILAERHQRKLQSLANDFQEQLGSKATVNSLVKIGKPSEEIIRQVLRDQHDLLLVSTRKHKSLKEHLLGGTTLDLMRQCPCPIWAVKPEVKDYQKIMVGIHFDEKVADQNYALNHELLRLTSTLAEKSTSELHIVNVITRHNPELSELRLAELNHLTRDIETPACNIKLQVLEGDVTKVLPEYAHLQGVDLLAMGMLSRTGFKGFFIGNTAEKILADLNCSVLTVKPKSFVSPITL